MTHSPKKQPVKSLLQDFQDLGLVEPSCGMPGTEHVIREDSLRRGGQPELRARIGDEYMDIYNYKPNVRSKVILMSKEEALRLAALINRTWPLDALGSV